MPQDKNGQEPNVDWYSVEEADLLDEDFELEDYEVEFETASLETALEAIQQDAVSPFDLTGFNDLTLKQVHQVRAAWHALDAEKRRTLADVMLALAGENIYADFGRFFGVLLEDEDAHVRLAAANGAAYSEATSNIKPLVELAEHDSDADVRESALKALAPHVLALDMGIELDGKDVQRLEKLKRWAQDESWPSALRAAALASWAVNTDDDETGAIIEAFAQSDDEVLHLGATRAMGAWGPGRLVPFLERQLQSHDVEHREAAARALGQADDAGVVPMLTMLAREDQEPQVREAAYLALADQGGKQALQSLNELRKHAADDELEIIDYCIQQVEELENLDEFEMFELDETDEEFD